MAVMLLLSLFYIIPDSIQLKEVYAQSDQTKSAAAESSTSPELPAPTETKIAPVTLSGLPSLVTDVQITPEKLEVGNTATLTVVVTNQAKNPAKNLTVTVPLPDGIQLLPQEQNGSTKLTKSGKELSWQAATLSGGQATTFTTQFQVQTMPVGEAVVAKATIKAVGLPTPLYKTGGALVEPATSEAKDKVTVAPATFAPGKDALLQSSNGKVKVKVPANASAKTLKLNYLSPEQKLPALKAANKSAPSDRPSFGKGFGTFYLEAQDAAAKEAEAPLVTRFDAPLTLEVSYTDQQLEALGISERDLVIYWFDEANKTWIPLPTTVDAATKTASTQVDHFSPFQMADGTNPSETFIPSLQGFQTSLFTGSGNYSYPIEVPAGTGGLQPNLSLNYSSAATDGASGLRIYQQAGWVGKGWSLTTGFVARNKITINGGTGSYVNYFSMVFNGESFDVAREEALVANPDQNNPSHWAWRSTNENFNKITVTPNGLSWPPNAGTGDPGRGGYKIQGGNQVWAPRYTWQIWTKDGTRYNFSEDLWYGWNDCFINNSVTIEAYKWLLSSVTDTSGNTINYKYDRARYNGSALNCDTYNGGGAMIDQDAWPTEINWSNNRHKVEFVSEERAADVDFEYSSFQYKAGNGAPRETRVLLALKVLSNPTGAAWELIRQYNLGTNRNTNDYLLYADKRTCSGGVCNPYSLIKKLTLQSITQVGNDGVTALPPVTFTYSQNWGTTIENVVGGWNRLIKVNNGRGGTVDIAYEQISGAVSYNLFHNLHRVVTKTLKDGRGNTYPWTYQYTSPAMNVLGTALGGVGPQTYPNSAALYYNKAWDLYHPNTQWLAQREGKEFRGHNFVTEIDPNGGRTEHWFYQGEALDQCVPTTTSSGTAGSHALIDGDPCFQKMRKQEFLKGQEYKSRVLAAGATNPLSEASSSFEVEFYSYGATPLSGLWRAFNYKSQTIAKTWEAGTTALTKRVDFKFDAAVQPGGKQWGNLTNVLEYDHAGNLYRSVSNAYIALDNGTSYIVDKPWQTVIRDGQSRLLGLTSLYYDGANTSPYVFGTPQRGKLTRITRYYDVPLAANTAGLTLHGNDVVYEYDSYGNNIKTTTYAGAGTRTSNADASGMTISAPGGGSTAYSTLSEYDPIYHILPTKQTKPGVNGVALINQASYDYRMSTLLSTTDPNLNVAQAEYDKFGRMVKLIKPGDTSAVPTLTATYYDTLQPLQYIICRRETAGAGGCLPEQKFYDGMGRLIQTKRESVDSAQNTVTDYQYDGLNNLLKTGHPRNIAETPATTFFQYVAPDGSVLWDTTSYDALKRPVVTTAADGAKSTYLYGVTTDAATGQVFTYADVTDPNRHRTQYRNDVFGRLAAVQEISGNCGSYIAGYACGGVNNTPWAVYAATKYDYSPVDLLTKVTDAKGNITTNSYDTLGRKVAMSDPDMGSWSYQYDINGNLTQQTDAKSQNIYFTYDALNRLTTKTLPGGIQSFFRYDEAGVPNGKGQMTSMSNPNAATAWQFNNRGLTIRAEHTIAGLSGSRVFQSSYDSAERLKTFTYPSNEVVTYSYDAAWRPTSACSSLGGCYASGAQYNSLSQMQSLTFGNGLTQSWNYNAQTHRLSQTSLGSLFSLSYTYDAGGNIKTLTNPYAAGGSQTQNFNYDDYDRLTQAWTTGSTTNSYNESYSYDQIGNLLNKAGTTYSYPTSGSGAVRPHTPTSIGSYSYSYDNNGNTTGNSNGWTYTWDAENQLTGATQTVPGGGCGTTTPMATKPEPAVQIAPATICPQLAGNTVSQSETYAYNALGSRVKRTANGVTTIYVGNIWEETLGSSNSKTYYSFSDKIVAMRTNTGTVTYLHSDSLGSTSAVTNASGQLVGQQEFDPWGKVRNGGNVTQTSISYTGQRLDDTGLMYYQARYYNPVTGRFISADSVVQDGSKTSLRALTVDLHEKNFVVGVNSENSYTQVKGFNFQLAKQEAVADFGPANPQSLNRYSYVLNNPLIYTDPSGHTIYMSHKEAADLAAGLEILANFFSMLGDMLTGVIDVEKIVELLGVEQAGALMGAYAGGGPTGLISYVMANAAAIADALGGLPWNSDSIQAGITLALESSGGVLEDFVVLIYRYAVYLLNLAAMIHKENGKDGVALYIVDKEGIYTTHVVNRETGTMSKLSDKTGGIHTVLALSGGWLQGLDADKCSKAKNKADRAKQC